MKCDRPWKWKESYEWIKIKIYSGLHPISAMFLINYGV